MKRMTAIVMALVLAVTICACGGKGAERGTQTSDKSGADTTAVSAHTEQDTDKQKEAEGTDGAEKRKTAEESAKETVSTGSTGEQADTEDEDMAALEALGDVETENGILTVSITVPADLKQLPQVLSFVEKKLDALQRNAVFIPEGCFRCFSEAGELCESGR